MRLGSVATHYRWTKREPFLAPFWSKASHILKRVAPVQKQGMPIAALAVSASRSRGYIRRIADSQVVRCLVCAGSQVGSVIPEPVDTDAHARRHEVPDVRLTQENSVAVELIELSTTSGSNHTGAGNPGAAITTDLH